MPKTYVFELFGSYPRIFQSSDDVTFCSVLSYARAIDRVTPYRMYLDKDKHFTTLTHKWEPRRMINEYHTTRVIIINHLLYIVRLDLFA